MNTVYMYVGICGAHMCIYIYVDIHISIESYMYIHIYIYISTRAAGCCIWVCRVSTMK